MEQIVRMFEHWVREARAGKVIFAGIAAVLTEDKLAIHHDGVPGNEANCRAAINHLDRELGSIEESRQYPPRNFRLGANCADYPLIGGISWDFLTWLVEAEMHRRRCGAPAPLKVAFSMQDRIDRQQVEFFNNVFRQLLPLIGAVESNKAVGGRYNPFFTHLNIVVAARSGEEVPKLKATDEAHHTMERWLHGTKPIVITLREADHFPMRNSNLEAWVKFAGDMQQSGKEVIFVRDTAKLTESLPGCATCPIAAIDVQYRMALYEQALINFCVSNGPSGLLTFGYAPYCFFVNLKEGDFNTLDTWRTANGLLEGEQWPWASSKQQLVWKTDTYENINEAWEQFNA